MLSGDKEPAGDGQSLQGLTRGLSVLEAIANAIGPLGVGEISRIVDLPKSTVQRILRTLANLGWVAQTDDPLTRWVVSARFLAIARKDVGEGRDLREVALPHMRTLCESTCETVHLSVREGQSRMVLIERVDSTYHSVRTFNAIGSASPIHASAAGKSVLAALPPAELDVILAAPLVHVTERTTVDQELLRKQLADAAERGYSISKGENRPNVCGVGSPIRSATGTCVGAVAISIPEFRFTSRKASQWGALVRQAGEAISRSLVV